MSRRNTDKSSIIAPEDVYDPVWDRALQRALAKLPETDQEWLRSPDSKTPFTSAQMFSVIEPIAGKYERQAFQRFTTKISPVLSHIGSFDKVISPFSQAQSGGGVIWGSIYLVITVAGRAQETLDRVLDQFEILSRELSLFQRWRQLFPGRESKMFIAAMKKVYVDVIELSIDAIRYMRRSSVSNFFRVLWNPSLEAKFKKYEERIRKHTQALREETQFAHAQAIKAQLDAIEGLVESVPAAMSNIVVQSGIPKVRMIPHTSNERFFGRKDILERMHKELDNALAPNRQRSFALYGLGGSGKTQIALEYTYQHLDEYQAVIWIIADNTGKIQQGFTEAATRLGCEGKELANVSQAKGYVLRRLSSSSDNYLLVFDNADDMSLLEDCIPRGGSGSILYTSRNAVMSEEFTPHGCLVPEFSLEESHAFLISLLPEALRSSPDDELERLSKMFHGYPLAISQVAGYIRTRGCNISQFLNIYEDRKHSASIAAMPMRNYHSTLATVWDLSFGHLGEQSKVVLEMLVYLDPDSIPTELFELSARNPPVIDPPLHLAFLSSAMDLLEALQGLRSQSLTVRNQELQTLSIHRFLQECAFNSICEDPVKRKRAFNDVLYLLGSIQPEFLNQNAHWSPHLWEVTEKYLPHIRALYARYQASPPIFQGCEQNLARLLYHNASYLFERNRFKTSLEFLKTVKELLKYVDKEQTLLLLVDCYRLEGRLWNENNSGTNAAKCFELAKQYADRAIAAGAMDLHDGRMIRIITGWGNALNELKQFDRALELQMEALQLVRGVSTEASDALYIVRLNWGFVLCRREEYEDAARVLEATLQDVPDNPAVHFALGNTYLGQGKIDEGLAEHLGALRGYTLLVGDTHYFVAISLYKVGDILVKKGDYNQARAILQRSLDIMKLQGEEMDTRCARARGSWKLAKVVEHGGDPIAARELYEQAWDLREEVTGIRGTMEDTDEDYAELLFYWDC